MLRKSGQNLKCIMLTIVGVICNLQFSNAQSWNSVGTGGAPGGVVYAMCTYGGSLLFAGDNAAAGGYVYQYNGTTVSQFTTQTYNLTAFPDVFAMQVYNNVLYIGGKFTSASGSASADNIAYWNTGTSKWSPLSSGGTSGASNYGVLAMTVWNGKLIVGGDFTKVNGGGATANYVATFDGTNWGTLPGLNGDVLALVVWNGNLYAGGSFTSPATGIAEWNGAAWVALGGGSISGSNGSVNPISVEAMAAVNGSPGYLYFGGDFKKAGATTANNIASWNGTSYAPLSTGATNGNGDGADVYGLLTDNGNVFAVGDFQTAGGTAVNFVGYWDGTSWLAMGGGFNSDTHSLWLWNNDLFAGGIMNNYASQPYIEQWSASMALPISLVSFDAVYNGDKQTTDLNWTTASQTNNKLFTIEKSQDGINWQFVTNMPGAGTTTTTLNYMATDETPFEGISYYRLKQTDYDGNYTYSEVRVITVSPGAGVVTLLPNPARNSAVLSFSSENNQVGEYSIYDCTGRQMNTAQIEISKGINAINLDVSSFTNGVYFISLINNGKQSVIKMLVCR